MNIDSLHHTGLILILEELDKYIIAKLKNPDLLSRATDEIQRAFPFSPNLKYH